MKIKKIGILVLLGVITTGGFALANNNSWKSQNIEKEAKAWESEIEKWDALHEKWYEKRENFYDKNFEDNFDRTRGKYCDEKGCFEEGIFKVEYKSPYKSFEISSMGSFEININDKSFKQRNGGQSLEFVNIKTNEKWESKNNGQSLEYFDEFGSTWESRNMGQSIEFNGSDGSFWKSSNHGQSLKFKDANGKTWESRNFGQSVENNGENVDFDIQNDLFNY